MKQINKDFKKLDTAIDKFKYELFKALRIPQIVEKLNNFLIRIG